MFKPCALILTYVSPSDDKRAQLFENLVKTLDDWFNIPILVVARDWSAHQFPDSPNLKVYRHNEPGITVARRFLRSIALASEYNYFIMFDDDTILDGNKELAQQYMQHLEHHAYDFAVTPIGPMLKLFGISRGLFEQVDFAPFTNDWRNDSKHWIGFEDAAFVGECLIRFPEHATFTTGLFNRTDLEQFSADSTWLTPEITPWVPLQYINTRRYLESISPNAIYYYSFLRLNVQVSGDFPAEMLYPLPEKQETLVNE